MILNLYCIIVSVYFTHKIVNSYITYIEPRVPLKGKRSDPGTPWPLPQVWTKSPNVLIVNPLEFEISTFAEECDVLQEAANRYKKIITGSKNGNIDMANSKGNRRASLSKVTIAVNEYYSCSYPQSNDDESYKIDISAEKQAWIESKTVWGALHALETLSQLIYEQSSKHNVNLLVNETTIHDWPSYTYRGVMIDTARHFIPVYVLKKNLEAMAINKMNVFHWHLVDDQSFPFESTTYPNLSKFGAFSDKHVYSQRDVKSIVEFARLRGIRVLPEIDSPGHTKSFGKSHPELLTPCYFNGSAYVAYYPQYSDSEVLNPTDENVYNFMISLFKELQKLFPEKYIHLGMDEVNLDCWQSNPQIREFMNRNKIINTQKLEQYYVKNLIDKVKDIGYKYIMWQDPIDNGVKAAEDTIIQVWKDSSLGNYSNWQYYAKRIANKGYKLIVSACWYLNYINYPYPGEDWEKYLNCDPRNFDGNNQHKSLVLGGEACLWSEFVDATNLLSRLWPRASAVAERLWNNPSEVDEDSTRFRLDHQRCHLVKRGIPAAPILNGFCGDYDWQMLEKE